MRSLTPAYLDALAFTAEDAATLQALGERRGRAARRGDLRPEVVESLVRHTVVESVTSSNRIEDVIAPPARIDAIVSRNEPPRNRSEQEIAGYRDALALVRDRYATIELSAAALLQLHAMIYRYTGTPGGRWKLADNRIAETSPDGSLRRIRFEPVRWNETEQAIGEFVRLHRDAVAAGRPPLVVVPLAVLDFLCIHPFSDCNGRVGRLLTLLLLLRAGDEAALFVSLDRIVEESRETYYEVLERSSRGWHEGRHDARPWLRYFWGVLHRAYAELESRAGATRGARGSKSAGIVAAVVRRTGAFSRADIERDCPGTSKELVRRTLRRLRAEGVLEPVGGGRGARWRTRSSP